MMRSFCNQSFQMSRKLHMKVADLARFLQPIKQRKQLEHLFQTIRFKKLFKKPAGPRPTEEETIDVYEMIKTQEVREGYF